MDEKQATRDYGNTPILTKLGRNVPFWLVNAAQEYV